jgi:aspartokinase
MKAFSRILLVLFVLFLSTPTVVTLIKKNTDTSMFYSFTEEEIHKELKEVKAEVKQHFDYPFLDLKINKNTAIISENLSRHDNVASEIFSPPPEIV